MLVRSVTCCAREPVITAHFYAGAAGVGSQMDVSFWVLALKSSKQGVVRGSDCLITGGQQERFVVMYRAGI